MNRDQLQALMAAPHGASRQAGAALKPDGGHGRRKDPKPAGYVSTPGLGPDGETCGSCGHLCRIAHAKTYLKCGLFRHAWTGSRKTDVASRSPACARWEAPLDSDTTL